MTQEEVRAYKRNWQRRKRLAEHGSVETRCLEKSPRAKLEFRSCYTGDCIVWCGASNKLGYGRLYINGTFHMAHRLAYELEHGQIPAGLEIDHLCRNPSCINPAHLEAVSHAVNVNRGTSRSATVKRFLAMTHCVNGHPRDGNMLETTYRGTRMRYCRLCRKDYRERAKRYARSGS